MKEQDQYVSILQKVIDETEKEHIRTTQEIITMLVYELSANKTPIQGR